MDTMPPAFGTALEAFIEQIVEDPFDMKGKASNPQGRGQFPFHQVNIHSASILLPPLR